MGLTLDDIMAAPTDPDELNKHLLTRGLIPPPPPPETPAPLVPAGAVSRPMVKPAPEVSNFTPPEITGMPGGDVHPEMTMGGTPAPVNPARGEPLAKTFSKPANVLSHPIIPGAGSVDTGAAPEIGGTPTPTKESLATGGGLAPITGPRVPTLKESAAAGGNKKEDIAAAKEIYQRERPQITSTDPTSSEYHQQRLAQDAYDLKHPWGADISAHPGTLGKIGHVAGLIGQIAGGAVAPHIVEQIPGTQAYREAKMAGEMEQYKGAKAREAQTAQQDLQQREGEQRLAKAESEQEIVRDAAGNIEGSKDAEGVYHSLADSPQAVKDMAAADQAKPTFEKTENGDIVQITPGKNGQPAQSDVVYKGNPKQKTEIRALVGADGHAHDQVIDVTPGSPTFGKSLADLGRSKEDKQESPTAALTKMKAGEEPVLGFDKDGHQHLVPRAQATEMGLQHIVKASDKDRQDAENSTSGLNEVGVKTRNLSENLKALDQGFKQRAIIAQALAHSSNTTADALIRGAVMTGASEPTQNFIIDALNLREAVLNLPKIMTGTSRMTEVQAEALWKTIVDGSAKDSKYGMKQLKKFDEMVDRQWRKVPEIEGNPRERAFPQQQGAAGGAAGGNAAPTAPPPPPPGKVTVVDPKGVPHFVNEKTANDFLNDPKYKGWKRAPTGR